MSIATTSEAVVKNEGAITVPAKILTAYVSLLKASDDIELAAADGATLEVKSPSSKTKIKGISAEEFPSIAEVKGGISLDISSEDFRNAVQEVAFAAQENSSRPILAGVFFKADKNELRMAATDSYRLSERLVKLGVAVDPKTCVIPVRAVLEADRLASHAEKVTIMIGENQVYVLCRWDQFDVTIDGRAIPRLPTNHSKTIYHHSRNGSRRACFGGSTGFYFCQTK
ncbi:hypothetical protein HC823_01245 [Candidatus Gracilibacteria bacterium]|nr:hypothetical protein [Candidatus Gracilibacteria bacterium]